MKTPFFAQRPLTINGGEIKPGDLVAEVTPAAGIPLEKALAAIAGGHATPEKREAPKAEKAPKPAAPAAPAAVPAESTRK